MPHMHCSVQAGARAVGLGLCLLGAGCQDRITTDDASIPAAAHEAAPSTQASGPYASADSSTPNTFHRMPQPASQPAQSTADNVPEAAFVSSQGLNGGVIDSFIDKPMFDKVMARIEADSDAVSHDKAQRYGRSMSEHFQRTDATFSVDRVACGRSACLMSIQAGIHEPQQFGDVLMTFNRAGELPMYSIVSQTIPGHSPGSAIHRLVFTTDPNLNSISAPAK